MLTTVSSPFLSLFVYSPLPSVLFPSNLILHSLCLSSHCVFSLLSPFFLPSFLFIVSFSLSLPFSHTTFSFLSPSHIPLPPVRIFTLLSLPLLSSSHPHPPFPFLFLLFLVSLLYLSVPFRAYHIFPLSFSFHSLLIVSYKYTPYLSLPLPFLPF